MGPSGQLDSWEGEGLPGKGGDAELLAETHCSQEGLLSAPGRLGVGSRTSRADTQDCPPGRQGVGPPEATTASAGDPLAPLSLSPM